MNETLLRRVRELRAMDPYHPMAMQAAVHFARYEQTPVPEPWRFLADLNPNYDGTCEITDTFGPLTITVAIVADENAELGDDDVSGTFTDKASPYTIKNRCRDWATDYDFYEPARVRREETAAEYSRYGMSKSVALDAMRAAVLQDMRDDASRRYYGITVRVSLDGRTLGRASLWAVDVIDGYDPRPYFVETAVELIEEALDQAKSEGPKRVRKAREYAAKLAGVVGEAPEFTIVIRSQSPVVRALVQGWADRIFTEGTAAAGTEHIGVEAYAGEELLS